MTVSGRRLFVITLLMGTGAALVWTWRTLPALSYGPDGPTRVGMFFTRLWARWATFGFPPSWNAALEVRGRRSGEPHVVPVVIGHWDGQDYLVSMLGERTSWVKNVRAADGEATIVHGRRRPVRLREVDPSERAPIIRAYLGRAVGGRPHIPVPYDAPVEAFEPIAGDYPVFLIEAAPDSTIAV